MAIPMNCAAGASKGQSEKLTAANRGGGGSSHFAGANIPCDDWEYPEKSHGNTEAQAAGRDVECTQHNNGFAYTKGMV